MAATPMNLGNTGVAFAGALVLVGCYHAQPLDERALLDRLRDPAVSASSLPPPSTSTVLSAIKPDGLLTEDEAVELALVHNPDMRAFRRERHVAEAAIVAASAIPNPSVKLEGLHLQNSTRHPGVGVSLRWAPPQPVEWAANRSEAQARLDEVQQEIFEREWQLATEVRSTYAAAVAFQEQLRLIEGGVARQRNIVELIEKRVQLGASTQLDANIARLAVGQLEHDHDKMEVERVVALRSLAALMGRLEPPSIAERPRCLSDDRETDLPDVRMLEDKALQARPVLRAAHARYRQREQALRRAYARRWPWLEIDAGPRYRFNSSSSNPDDFMLAVEVTLPVLDWNSGAIRMAEAEREQERELIVAALSHLRRDIATARDRLEVQRHGLLRYRDKVLPALVEHERLLDLAVRGGQADVKTLLTAADVILRHQRAHCQIMLEHRRAWLALELAVGARLTEETPREGNRP